jgi:hypothetical protein
MKAMFVLLVGLVLMGCGATYTDEYTILIDPNFDAEDTQAVFNATAAWTAISDGRLRFDVSVGKAGQCSSEVPGQICVWASSQDWIVANGGEPNFVGMTDRHNNNFASIYIPTAKDMGFDITQQTQILIHETGHALGASHTQTGTIMCAEMGCAPLLPTCADLNQIMSLRGETLTDKTCPQAVPFELTGAI